VHPGRSREPAQKRQAWYRPAKHGPQLAFLTLCARQVPCAGSLLNSSLEAVGGYSGAVAGTGRVIDLATGESAGIPVIFGTASTREDLGYVLPPGRYWLRVQMRLHHGPGAPLTTTPAAPLTQVTIIPRDRELRHDQAGRH